MVRIPANLSPSSLSFCFGYRTDKDRHTKVCSTNTITRTKKRSEKRAEETVSVSGGPRLSMCVQTARNWHDMFTFRREHKNTPMYHRIHLCMCTFCLSLTLSVHRVTRAIGVTPEKCNEYTVEKGWHCRMKKEGRKK